MTWHGENTRIKGRLLPGEKSYDCLSYPLRAVLSFINWPIGVEPANPETVLPRYLADPVMGHYVMRNRWKDADDIIVTALLGARPHKGIAQRIVVWGLGRRFSIGTFKATRATSARGAEDGSGVVSANGLGFAADFSKASGAEALIVLTGAAAGGPAPAKIDGDRVRSTTVTAGGTAFTVIALHTGAAPEVTVAGDTVVVGKQVISTKEGRIVLAVMGGPPTLPK